MNKIEIIRSQFEQSSLYTPPSQNCANLTQFRPISDENPRNSDQHEENNMWCISLQNKLFHGIQRSPTKNMDKDNQDITIQWAPFSSPGKKLLSGCSSNLVNCIGNSKNINPSVIYYSSSNELQRLSSFNSPHSFKIKTYCLPTRLPSTNTIQHKQSYSTYVMQSLKMLNVTN